MRHFCTYFDRNYLAKGLTLIRSIAKWHGDNATIFVVCMDEFTRVILNELAIPQVVLVPLHLIEQGDERLLATRFDRSVVEYLWTLTPTIILRLLEFYPEVEILTYVDADMFFYRSAEDLYGEFGGNSVLIHEHRFPKPLEHLIEFGRFNVGLLIFRRDDNGLSVLKWWRDRCIEWCRSTLEDGKYGDQKYLDLWPELFKGVLATSNLGVGVAPWNHAQYLFTEDDSGIFINNAPLIIYHFHAFQVLNEAAIVPVGIADYRTPLSFFKIALPPYLKELERSIQSIRLVDPEFQFGLQKSDFKLIPELSFIVRTEALPQLQGAIRELPHQPISNDWEVFLGASVI